VEVGKARWLEQMPFRKMKIGTDVPTKMIKCKGEANTGSSRTQRLVFCLCERWKIINLKGSVRWFLNAAASTMHHLWKTKWRVKEVSYGLQMMTNIKVLTSLFIFSYLFLNSYGNWISVEKQLLSVIKNLIVKLKLIFLLPLWRFSDHYYPESTSRQNRLALWWSFQSPAFPPLDPRPCPYSCLTPLL